MTPPALPVLQKVEPLRAAEWTFPLGCATARLEIVADEGREIVPEDMDALLQIVSLFRANLQRRVDAGKRPPLPASCCDPET